MSWKTSKLLFSPPAKGYGIASNCIPGAGIAEWLERSFPLECLSSHSPTCCLLSGKVQGLSCRADTVRWVKDVLPGEIWTEPSQSFTLNCMFPQNVTNATGQASLWNVCFANWWKGYCLWSANEMTALGTAELGRFSFWEASWKQLTVIWIQTHL